MAIRFACPCGKNLTAPDTARGKVSACPRCGRQLAPPAVSTRADRPAGQPRVVDDSGTGEFLLERPSSRRMRLPVPPASGRWKEIAIATMVAGAALAIILLVWGVTRSRSTGARYGEVASKLEIVEKERGEAIRSLDAERSTSLELSREIEREARAREALEERARRGEELAAQAELALASEKRSHEQAQERARQADERVRQAEAQARRAEDEAKKVAPGPASAVEMLAEDAIDQARLIDIFQNAGLQAKPMDRGEVLVETENGKTGVSLDADKKLVQFRKFYGFRKASSAAQRLAFVNKVNDEVILVRCSVSGSGSDLCMDYSLVSESGLSPSQIMASFRRFDRVAVLALRAKDEGKIIE